eukprot:scaffold84684_cov32-Tisochrysis_lutea.AAC.1
MHMPATSRQGAFVAWRPCCCPPRDADKPSRPVCIERCDSKFIDDVNAAPGTTIVPQRSPCALWVPNVQFLDVEGRDIIHPFSIHEERLKLLCTICEKSVGVRAQLPLVPPTWHGAGYPLAPIQSMHSMSGTTLPHSLSCNMRSPDGMAYGREGKE